MLAGVFLVSDSGRHDGDGDDHNSGDEQRNSLVFSEDCESGTEAAEPHGQGVYHATTVPLMKRNGGGSGGGADDGGDPNELGIPRTSIHRWLPKGQRGLLQRQAELLVNGQPQHEKHAPEAAVTTNGHGPTATIDGNDRAGQLGQTMLDDETHEPQPQPQMATKAKMYTDIF